LYERTARFQWSYYNTVRAFSPVGGVCGTGHVEIQCDERGGAKK